MFSDKINGRDLRFYYFYFRVVILISRFYLFLILNNRMITIVFFFTFFYILYRCCLSSQYSDISFASWGEISVFFCAQCNKRKRECGVEPSPTNAVIAVYRVEAWRFCTSAYHPLDFIRVSGRTVISYCASDLSLSTLHLFPLKNILSFSYSLSYFSFLLFYPKNIVLR